HRLMDNRLRSSQFRWDQPHLLKGKLRTYEDFAMSPSSVHRPIRRRNINLPGAGAGQKRLVRYYVSQKGIQQGHKNCAIKTLNASHLENLVRAVVLGHLDEELRANLNRIETMARDHWVRQLIDRVVVAPDELIVELNEDQIEALREYEWPPHDAARPSSAIARCLYKPETRHFKGRVRLTLSMQIKRFDGKRMLLSPEGRDLVMPAEAEPQPHIVRAIGTAYAWRDRLIDGRLTVAGLMAETGVGKTRTNQLLRLTCLGPVILKMALTGQLPISVTLKRLTTAAGILDWDQQQRYLGLDANDQAPVVESD
ncbi:MAG: hypothetical protein AAF593_00005, partial [Planctomycetota bacterium]